MLTDEEIFAHLEGYKRQKEWRQNFALLSNMVKPLVRRVYPGIMANQIVSVQPMAVPTTTVFHFEHPGKPDKK